MGKENIYYCDCCDKEFREPSYDNPPMGIVNFKVISNDTSMGNSSLTLGKNGSEVYLCNECTAKMRSKFEDMGFANLYDGCSKIGIN